MNMNRRIAILCLLLLLACVTSDPISDLAKRLNSQNGMWINGLYPEILLPPTASTTEVINEAVKISGFDEGHIKEYHIVTTRKLLLNDGNLHEYTAILLDSDRGRKILLMRHNGHSWWTRFYKVATGSDVSRRAGASGSSFCCYAVQSKAMCWQRMMWFDTSNRGHSS